MQIYIAFIIAFTIEVIIGSLLPSNSYIKLKGHIESVSVRRLFTSILCVADFVWLGYIMYARDTIIGTDLKNYLWYYKNIGSNPWSKIFYLSTIRRIEIGYAAFFKIIYQFNSSPDMYMLVSSTIIIIFLMIFVLKNSNNALYSLCLFVYFGYYNESFNIVRQFIAVSLLMTTLVDIQNKDLKRFVIKTVLISLIHKTAIIYLLLYILVNKLGIHNKTKLFGFSLASFAASLFLGSTIASIARRIFSNRTYGVRDGAFGGIIIVEIIITLAFIAFYDQFNNSDERAAMWVISLLGLHMDLFYRMGFYFSMGYIISIPSFLKSFSIKSTSIGAHIAVYTMFVSYYLYSLQTSNMAETIPYLFRK